LWGYLNGVVFILCALGLVTKRYDRLSAITLGVAALVITLIAYVPLTLQNASDVTTGLNYLAIHFALAGAALILAGAMGSESRAA
jgi:hypothetical protein